YEFAREFWGHGFATEGARRAVTFGWEQTPLARIISATRPDHLASRRVMEKCGLTFQAEVPYRGTKVVWYAIDRPPGREASSGGPQAASISAQRQLPKGVHEDRGLRRGPGRDRRAPSR